MFGQPADEAADIDRGAPDDLVVTTQDEGGIANCAGLKAIELSALSTSRMRR